MEVTFEPSEVRTVELEEEEQPSDGPHPSKKMLEVKIIVRSSTGPALNNVVISIDSVLPLTTHPSHYTLHEVSSTHVPPPLILTVVATPTLLPTTTSLTLSATYTSNGIPRAMKTEAKLPVVLFCEPELPDKNAQHKVAHW